MAKIKIMKKKYLTSLLTTELLSTVIIVWWFYPSVALQPWPSLLFINLICAGYMISRCIFKNNSARKQSAWLTTEWYAFLACQWINYRVFLGAELSPMQIGGFVTGILIVYLITRGITKHNVNRAIIM